MITVGESQMSGFESESDPGNPATAGKSTYTGAPYHLNPVDLPEPDKPAGDEPDQNQPEENQPEENQPPTQNPAAGESTSV